MTGGSEVEMREPSVIRGPRRVAVRHKVEGNGSDKAGGETGQGSGMRQQGRDKDWHV